MRVHILLGLVTVVACKEAPKPSAPMTSAASEALAAHAKSEFGARQVLTPAPGVHVAIGFGLANTIWLEGPDGVVVVDTLGTLDSAAQAKATLRKTVEGPIRAVVYTHNHADHVFGAKAFLEGTTDAPVIAHETTGALVDKIVSDLRPIIYARSMRMFGHPLPQDHHLGCGIGPALDHDPARIGFVRPTLPVKDRLQTKLAGLDLVFEHAPGETDDQIFVWLPEAKALLPGDNFYRSFPNLYTIRGTSHRDVKRWVRSIDRMLELAPEVLVPSHTRPIVGGAEVRRALTDYRDAIQYVHDQTVRGMNRGLGPDALAAQIQLPTHLATSPYLQPFYGTVPWSVRSIFAGYLGWFDGNPAHLEPLPAPERAQRWQALLPRGESLLDAARRALKDRDWQWAAELADLHLAAHPGDPGARAALAEAFTALGEAHPSANGRNFYLTRAAELRGEVEIHQPDLSDLPISSVEHLPAWRFLASMPVYLRADEAADVTMQAAFRFEDQQADYGLEVRRGVAIFTEGRPEAPDFTISTTSETWKGVVLRRINPAKAALTGDLTVDGDLAELVRFLGLFDRP